MKKKLEADLISIAHRVLKLKSRSELIQLHKETQKLYEKLSVLCFVEENFSEVKPTLGLQAIEEKIEEIFITEKETIEKPKEVKEPTVEKKQVKNNISTSIIAVEEEEKDVEKVSIKPDIELSIVDKKQESKKITMEDVLEGVQSHPVFVRVQGGTSTREKDTDTKNKDEKNTTIQGNTEKLATLNNQLKRGIHFGLNDRIAFEKQLFGNSSEDLNRVISQLNTLNSYNEAKEFIEHLVKPDYNNWERKEEYENRFMELIESKFN